MKTHWLAIPVILFMSIGQRVYAEEPVDEPVGEREVLTRIVAELDHLQSMVNDAETQRQARGRLQFQYHWFRRDLEHVKQGVLDYLYGPNNAAVNVPPLRAGYQR